MLPTGYAGMILLALFPPAWRRVMDPRVVDHFDGDVSLANISPRRRTQVLAAHPSSPRVRRAAPVLVTSPTMERAASVACPGCGYTYDPALGDEREGFPAGTPWTDVPAGWTCPDCGVREKSDFVPVGGARSGDS